MPQEYRIFVGLKTQNGTDVEATDVIEKVSDFFDGFTVRQGVGFWKGEQEPSLTFEIVSDVEPEAVTWLAKFLALEFDQSAVMVESRPVTVEFVMVNA